MNKTAENAQKLSTLSILFMLKNGLPLGEGFEETIGPIVMEGIVEYYIQHDMEFDLAYADLNEDAVKYAFGRLQGITDMMRQAVDAMTGGGLS